MAYSEQDGQVTLTMSREQYDQLIRMVATATVHFWPDTMWILRLMNSLNQGNPNYIPYKVKDEASCR